MGRCQCKLREARQMLGLARTESRCRIPILDLGGKRYLHARGVEQRDGSDTALAGADSLPAL